MARPMNASMTSGSPCPDVAVWGHPCGDRVHVPLSGGDDAPQNHYHAAHDQHAGDSNPPAPVHVDPAQRIPRQEECRILAGRW